MVTLATRALTSVELESIEKAASMIDPADGENEPLTTVVTLLAAAVMTGVDASIVGPAVAALGVAELDGDEGLLVPIALVAVTVKVYGVPFVSGLTTALVAEAPALAVTPPGDDVTV